ncbi:hypothetical protein H1R20_g9519, partial [Candolleomyces eurysporus]
MPSQHLGHTDTPVPVVNDQLGDKSQPQKFSNDPIPEENDQLGDDDDQADTTGNAELKKFADTLVHRFGLSSRIEEALDEFIGQRPTAKRWSMSEKLKAAIEQYSRAMILAPNISAYRGTLDTQVLGAMRALAIKDLPPQDDTHNTKLILKEIGLALTSSRSTVKSLISQSRSKSSSLKNIASLVTAVVRDTQVPHTLQLYRRVAFLRWLMEAYPENTASDWWIKVDEKLAKTYQELSSELEIDRLFDQVYEDDVAKFGDPRDIGAQFVEPAALPGWLQVVDQYSTHVVAQKSRAKKRKLFPE